MTTQTRTAVVVVDNLSFLPLAPRLCRFERRPLLDVASLLIGSGQELMMRIENEKELDIGRLI